MSELAYLDYFLRNSGTVEASKVTYHGKAVNPALLQTGFYFREKPEGPSVTQPIN